MQPPRVGGGVHRVFSAFFPAAAHRASSPAASASSEHLLTLSLPAEFQNIDILVNNAGLAAGVEKIQDGNVDK